MLCVEKYFHLIITLYLHLELYNLLRNLFFAIIIITIKTFYDNDNYLSYLFIILSLQEYTKHLNIVMYSNIQICKYFTLSPNRQLNTPMELGPMKEAFKRNVKENKVTLQQKT